MVSPGQEVLDHRLTHRDLDYTPDDGNRYEIIDGELYVTPFPTYTHQLAASELFAIIHRHVAANALGRVFTAGLKVVLDEPSGVGPDIIFIATANMPKMKPDGFYGCPDLVVEVLSSKPELDRFVKLNKYAKAGVSNYWIVDPKQKLLSAYQIAGQRYRLVSDKSGDIDFEPQLFPGLCIPLGNLWG